MRGKTKLIGTIGVTSGIVCYALHRIGYYSIWFWDILGHTLGGFSVACVAFGVFYLIGLRNRTHDYLTVCSTLLIALLWEAYELLFWAEATKFPSDPFYYEDTTLDIAIAVIGAQLLIIVTHRYYDRNRR